MSFPPLAERPCQEAKTGSREVAWSIYHVLAHAMSALKFSSQYSVWSRESPLGYRLRAWTIKTPAESIIGARHLEETLVQDLTQLQFGSSRFLYFLPF
ncbi:hypothetical protein RRG08_062486 [Elysia crispata]|uniref:Uncharacterized protein n=1 Tax=Elysia crispata TaxID=231223 RepID=A0AAE0YKK0_9GAST|nr:hypothetical protein RRG08_062486 [Elysia crispata]